MQHETKSCPRCWELSPMSATTCAACRYEFPAQSAQPSLRAQEDSRPAKSCSLWPFGRKKARAEE